MADYKDHCGFSCTYHLSFELKMHIIVKSIVVVRSLKHQHSVSRGRAAGNVGDREIHIDAEKQFRASLHFGTQGYSYQVGIAVHIGSHQNHVWMGHWQGHKQAGLLLGSPTPTPKHTCRENIRKQRRSENQVQMCSCAKKT